MHYVKQFNINGVDTKQVACIELQGKPNSATEGAVGLLGIDVASPTHDVYKCVAVNGSIYTWELLSSGMSTLAATISGNGAESVQFPYDKMKIPSGYVLKTGDLIIDNAGYLYQVSSIDVSFCNATYCGAAFLKGEQGEPGLSPYIGENGNWWVGDTDTGVDALGRKPWDVNENVGSIVVNPISYRDTPDIGDLLNWEIIERNEENLTKTSVYGIEIPLINSGDIYLHFDFIYSDSNASNGTPALDSDPRLKYYKLKIYLNENVIKEVVSDSFEGYTGDYYPIESRFIKKISSLERPILLNGVSKGDIIRLEIESTIYFKTIYGFNREFDYHRGGGFLGHTFLGTGFDKVYLSANINTPYKYIALMDRVETEDIEEILNTLLGV